MVVIVLRHFALFCLLCTTNGSTLRCSFFPVTYTLRSLFACAFDSVILVLANLGASKGCCMNCEVTSQLRGSDSVDDEFTTEDELYSTD